MRASISFLVFFMIAADGKTLYITADRKLKRVIIP